MTNSFGQRRMRIVPPNITRWGVKLLKLSFDNIFNASIKDLELKVSLAYRSA